MPTLTVDTLPELATPQEVAAVLRCSPNYVKAQCRDGVMGSRLIAGRYLISPQDVRDYLEMTRCLVKTKAVACGSEIPPASGTSAGTKAEGDARIQRARETVARLKGRSLGSSSTGKTMAPVIPLTGR